MSIHKHLKRARTDRSGSNHQLILLSFLFFLLHFQKYGRASRNLDYVLGYPGIRVPKYWLKPGKYPDFERLVSRKTGEMQNN